MAHTPLLRHRTRVRARSRPPRLPRRLTLTAVLALALILAATPVAFPQLSALREYVTAVAQAPGDDGEDGQGDGGQQDEDGGQQNGGQDQGGQQNGGAQQGTGDEDQGRDGRRDGNNDGQQDSGLDAAEFPGRDQIAEASQDDYIDINQVESSGNIGLGGDFSGGSYSLDCGTSSHNNSDNYLAAPGKRNGAQHMHDYVGNESTNAASDDQSLASAGTTCTTGDQSTFFWPVLRDTSGTGPDQGQDGGGRDGNVGEILEPLNADITFHGHGSQPVEEFPRGLEIIMGNAKALAEDGENANAKYTCTGFEDRVTDLYPICPQGSNLQRLLDYPSCWDGENLTAENLRDHMQFADNQGECSEDTIPVPALRITLTYEQPQGQNFAIDTFPDNQHSPSTDHSDFENLAAEEQNQQGAQCINNNMACR